MLIGLLFRFARELPGSLQRRRARRKARPRRARVRAPRCGPHCRCARVNGSWNEWRCVRGLASPPTGWEALPQPTLLPYTAPNPFPRPSPQLLTRPHTDTQVNGAVFGSRRRSRREDMDSAGVHSCLTTRPVANLAHLNVFFLRGGFAWENWPHELYISLYETQRSAKSNASIARPVSPFSSHPCSACHSWKSSGYTVRPR